MSSKKIKIIDKVEKQSEPYFDISWETWPVVKLTLYHAEPTDDQWNEYLETFKIIYNHDERFKILIDASRLKDAGMGFLLRQAEFNLAYKEQSEKLTVCAALVIGSAVFKNMIGMFLKMTPYKMPIESFDTVELAKTWVDSFT